MRRTKRVLTAVLITCFLQVSCNESTKKEIKSAKKEAKMKKKEKQKRLRHMVLFKFNDDASEAEVSKLNDDFNALPEHISAIKDFEWGLNDSPENFHQDFTHCYMLTFHSEKERDSIYTPHPKHQEFVASLQPYVEKVFVVDYWAN